MDEAMVKAGRLLLAAEAVAYWLAGAPLLALLPATLAYRAACWRGNWLFRLDSRKRTEVVSNLRQVLGEELSQQEAERVARDAFRIRACEVIDLMRLRGRARSLQKLVEIRGRDHLDGALAGGKGAILCTAHIGSFNCAFSLLHAGGFLVTSVGRWWWKYPPGGPTAERRVWDWVYARRLLRHRHRPHIEPWPGRFQTAAQAAAVLRGNEVLTICSDAPPLAAEADRTIKVPMLGRQVSLLPGVVTLARLTGAPVLMMFAHRSADSCHQVVEISAPVSMDGQMVTAFGRCAAAIDAAITAHPAEWDVWFEQGDLARLGLFRDASCPAAQADERADRIGGLQHSSK